MTEQSLSASIPDSAAPITLVAGEETQQAAPVLSGNGSHPEASDEAVIRAERIAFLALASELAAGRKVLVVDDGASALTGVAEHLDSAEHGRLDEVEGGAYDLVVADIGSAGEETSVALAHLARVVSDEQGLALVRLPNRPEFDQLIDQLKEGFARTLTLRQHNWVASALLDDAMFENDDPSRAVAAAIRKTAAARPDAALYNVVVATQGAFPSFRPQLTLTRSPELARALVELAKAERRAEIERADFEAREAEQDARIRELEEQLAWYDEHQLALRDVVEKSSLASSLLSIWIAFASNIDRIRRVLRS